MTDELDQPISGKTVLFEEPTELGFTFIGGPEVTTDDVADWWRTAIIDMEPGRIAFRGHPVEQLIGSVSFAFLVVHAKMKQADHAAKVATGAVLARLAVIFIKIGVTVLMTLTLAFGIVLT